MKPPANSCPSFSLLSVQTYANEYTCICSLLLGNPIGDHRVARVGRLATDYIIVVRPWESGIQPCISCHFPTVLQLQYICMPFSEAYTGT